MFRDGEGTRGAYLILFVDTDDGVVVDAQISCTETVPSMAPCVDQAVLIEARADNFMEARGRLMKIIHKDHSWIAEEFDLDHSE